MFKITDARDKDTQGLVNLTYTRFISKQDMVLPEWKWLSQQYKDVEGAKNRDSVLKVALSIVNSMIFQRRAVFCLTRDTVEKFYKDDRNWTKELGWNSKYYSEAIGFLCRQGIIENISYVGENQRKPHIYKVISKDILNFFTLDVNLQTQQCLDFVSYSGKSKIPKNFKDLQYLNPYNGVWCDAYVHIGKDAEQADNELGGQIRTLISDFNELDNKQINFEKSNLGMFENNDYENNVEWLQMQTQRDVYIKQLDLLMEKAVIAQYYSYKEEYDSLESRVWGSKERMKERELKKASKKVNR